MVSKVAPLRGSPGFAASTRDQHRQAAAVAFAVTALTAAQAQTGPQPRALAPAAQSIQQQLNALKTEVTALQTANASLQDEVGALHNQLAAVQANPALGLGPIVNVDPNPEVSVAGPNVTGGTRNTAGG
ncbi:MAG TPA: hypothetical protein VGD78_16875 [Chthoniobacterales bacterium]